MVFSSLLFLFQFFPVVLLLYFIIPRRFLGARNLVLLVSSLVFYAWGEPVTISLMVFSILMNSLLGWMVQKYCDNGQRGRARGLW